MELPAPPKLISLIAEDKRKGVFECSCGKLYTTYLAIVKSGRSRSCGCWKKAMNTRHGYSSHFARNNTRVYVIWNNMKNRCLNPNAPNYYLYGGRGIKVCERWQTFDHFVADMGEPKEGYTLDRKDNDGDYSPENCRWATAREQGRNKRNNNVVCFRGEDMCITELAERVNIPRQILYWRIKKGWDVERAATTHPDPKFKPKRNRPIAETIG